jgi:hypothetical protein
MNNVLMTQGYCLSVVLRETSAMTPTRRQIFRNVTQTLTVVPRGPA